MTNAIIVLKEILCRALQIKKGHMAFNTLQNSVL